RKQIERVAREIAGIAVPADVSDRASVAQLVSQTEGELGPVDVLANNAGVMSRRDTPPIWEEDPADWWRGLEVNVLGAYLCFREGLRGVVGRGRGGVITVGRGAAYLPAMRGNAGGTAYGASKAALYRFADLLAAQLAQRDIAVFTISPGLVRTAMTESFGDDAPWTPPELAPRLVRVLASGRAARLAGRYIHAEHDDIEELIQRAEEIGERDLNAIRLRRADAQSSPT